MTAPCAESKDPLVWKLYHNALRSTPALWAQHTTHVGLSMGMEWANCQGCQSTLTRTPRCQGCGCETTGLAGLKTPQCRACAAGVVAKPFVKPIHIALTACLLLCATPAYARPDFGGDPPRDWSRLVEALFEGTAHAGWSGPTSSGYPGRAQCSPLYERIGSEGEKHPPPPPTRPPAEHPPEKPSPFFLLGWVLLTLAALAAGRLLMEDHL